MSHGSAPDLSFLSTQGLIHQPRCRRRRPIDMTSKDVLALLLYKTLPLGQINRNTPGNCRGRLRHWISLDAAGDTNSA